MDAYTVELRAVLAEAVESDGGIRYENEDDEVGSRCCCGVVSYNPHAVDCWVTRATEVLSRGAQETP